MKKLISILTTFALVISLCATLLPTEAHAATVTSGTCGDNLTWVLDDTGTLTISGTGAMTNYRSPALVPWYDYRSSVKAVVITDGVTTICEWAFSYCSSLTSVTIGNSVTSIGKWAFRECTNLTSITIGNSVTSIGTDAFMNCTNLTYNIYDNAKYLGNAANKYMVLVKADSTGITSCQINPITRVICGGAFWACTNLTSISIPDSVTNIGTDAFYYCMNLTGIQVSADNEVYSSDEFGVVFNKEKTTLLICPGGMSGSYTIPDSVTTISDYAFSNCSKLTSISIPDSVTTIGNYAFYVCKGLTSISIPDSVTTIGDSAFSNCSKLTSITIPDSITTIGDHAFSSCSSLTSITIPDSITTIGDSTFSYCSSLIRVTIPNSVTTIGDYAFSNCSKLTSITIPNSVTSIGNYAFSNCSKLTSISIPDSVTTIGDSVFSGCSNLAYTVYGNAKYLGNTLNKYVFLVKASSTDITNCQINPNTKIICASAFSDCSKLTSISIPDSVTTIGDDAFYRCTSLISVAIPDGVTSIGEWAFYNCTSLTGITIPDSVTSISDGAFSGCSSLTSITIPDSVTTIGDDAFYRCTSLTSVVIGNSVTTIGDDTFYYCTSLTSISIPDSVTSIGRNAFSNCSKLTSISIPESVTNISYGTFSSCSSLTSITIPNSVTSIGNYAFSNCTSLTKVIYCGTEEQWNAISVGSYNNTSLTSATRLYHDWADATCAEPKTCTICGMTEGEPLGHLWFGDSCTTENTCFVCGETGIPGHIWNPATCTTPITCSICGETSGTALGHNYAYTNNNDGTHTHSCSGCGDGITSAHSYVDNTCVCGHTLVDMITSSQATLKAMLQLDFNVNTSLLTGTDNYAVITHTYADGSTDVVTVPQSQWGSNGKQASYSKIAAKEMGDAITIVIYNAKGQQLSIPETDSIKAYAYRGLKSMANTTVPSYVKLRTLLVDMLNYGAAAQVQFKYDTDNLVNADMTAAQKAWATQNDVVLTNNQVKDAATHSTALTLKSAIQIDFIFFTSKVGTAADWANRYAIVTYTDHYGNEKTMRIEGTDFAKYYNNNYVQVNVVGMAVADYQSVVTCVIYDTNGNVLATAADSMEGYAKRALDSGEAGEVLENLCKALMKFSASADAYFK